MTFLWFLIWLIEATPHVEVGHTWNNWGIALVVCVVIDLVGGKATL